MNETTPLEQFSALDDWAPSVPAWQVYRAEAADPCSIEKECAD
jgi:hypothetical protein